MKDTSLLCTFITPDILLNIANRIPQKYTLAFGKIYVLENIDDPKQLILTYNIEKYSQNLGNVILPTTISVHRKRSSNTLYTINALNMLVAQQNDGMFGMQYNVRWDEVRNCILVTANTKIKIIRTKLQQIIETNGNEGNTTPYREGHQPA